MIRTILIGLTFICVCITANAQSNSKSDKRTNYQNAVLASFIEFKVFYGSGHRVMDMKKSDYANKEFVNKLKRGNEYGIESQVSIHKGLYFTGNYSRFSSNGTSSTATFDLGNGRFLWIRGKEIAIPRWGFGLLYYYRPFSYNRFRLFAGAGMKWSRVYETHIFEGSQGEFSEETQSEKNFDPYFELGFSGAISKTIQLNFKWLRHTGKFGTMKGNTITGIIYGDRGHYSLAQNSFQLGISALLPALWCK